MQHMLSARRALSTTLLLLAGCGFEEGFTDGFNGAPFDLFGGGSGEAAAALSAKIILPNEGDPLENPETDDSIVVEESGGTMTSVQPGQAVTVTIPFNAPNGNVVAAGIRFGDNGPIRTVNIAGAAGTTQGTLQFEFQVPDSICDDLSQICHDIKCYEFAVTDVGRVSRANIGPIAMACGGCDEPSCADLLDECLVGDCQSATSCDTGGEIQSCVQMRMGSDPRCWYQLNDQRFECPCSDISPCADRAVQACNGS